MDLAVVVNPSVLMVEVSDPAPRIRIDLRSIRPPSEDAENGCGLILARAMTDKLEIVVTDNRKGIRATFEKQPSSEPS